MTPGAVARAIPGIVRSPWLLLGAGAVLAVWLIGLDQGQTLSLFVGDVAYQQQLIHELFHDLRHVAALPCH